MIVPYFLILLLFLSPAQAKWSDMTWQDTWAYTQKALSLLQTIGATLDASGLFPNMSLLTKIMRGAENLESQIRYLKHLELQYQLMRKNSSQLPNTLVQWKNKLFTEEQDIWMNKSIRLSSDLNRNARSSLDGLKRMYYYWYSPEKERSSQQHANNWKSTKEEHQKYEKLLQEQIKQNNLMIQNTHKKSKELTQLMKQMPEVEGQMQVLQMISIVGADILEEMRDTKQKELLKAQESIGEAQYTRKNQEEIMDQLAYQIQKEEEEREKGREFWLHADVRPSWKRGIGKR